MKQNPGNKLFGEFPPVPVSEWEELIKKDLKGADYEKKLIWKTIEGIPIKPYYTAADTENLSHIRALPGKFPYVRGTRERMNEWLVRQDIPAGNVEEANTAALDALMKGAGSIGFILEPSKSYKQEDLVRLLHDICLASAEINFVSTHPPGELLRWLDDVNISRGGAVSDLFGSVEYDPLGTLFTTGNYPFGEEKAFGLAAGLTGDAGRIPRFTALNVNASVFHNAGGSAVQELAFAMASAAAYLDRLSAAGISAEQAATKIRFTLAAGSNYFMEIAKFRAARYLWSQILRAWDTGPEAAAGTVVHAVTSMWNKTVYDSYVNMLRSTTEAMAAVLGGADSLSVHPFDKAFNDEGTPFSRRISRNTQLVMKEEAYLDKVADPAAGSYYIESLTSSLIEEAWRLFIQVDGGGGVEKAFLSGTMGKMIAETAARRDSFIATRRDTLLGTNQYPNPDETVNGKYTSTSFWPRAEDSRSAKPEGSGSAYTEGDGSPDQQAGDSAHPEMDGRPLAEPLRLYRGAEAFEELRMKTEMHPGGPPEVFLLTYGNLAMRKARAGFSTGFFSCAGFRVTDNHGFDSVHQGAEAALKSKAPVVVVCSSDPEYPEIVPEIAGIIDGKAILVVAGYPKENLEMLKEAGVKYFIHIKSNVLETLRQFQQDMGIN